jgi:hypothetical protein
MKGAPLTVTEARVILRADEALDFTCEARLSAGTTLSDEEREAWLALVESANDRIAAWDGTKHKEALRPAELAEAQALRTGIETILKAFGTNSAEWTQQFRALLDRVPVTACHCHDVFTWPLYGTDDRLFWCRRCGAVAVAARLGAGSPFTAPNPVKPPEEIA